MSTTSARTTKARANGSARNSDKPAGVALNLDTLEREGAPAEPFVAVIGGKRREFADPFEMDWQEAEVAATDPRMMLKLALSEDDYAEVVKERIPIHKLITLSETWMRWYGLDPEAARGNLAASPI